MTEEEKAASKWFASLNNEQVRELIVESYRAHLKHVEERKELGFKW